MSEAPRPQVWRRVAAESVAIVGSILVAFAIQAWWESRQDARTLQSHLAGVRAELQESRLQIDGYVENVQESSAASRTLLALEPEKATSLSADSVARLIDRSISAGSVTLPTGAVEALIASGDLSLLDDKTLSSRLAAWPSAVRRAEEGGAVLRSLREEQIVPFIGGYSASLAVLKLSGWLDDYPTSRRQMAVEAMLADPQFEAHFALRGLRLEVTRAEYDRLAADAEELLAALESVLDE